MFRLSIDLSLGILKRFKNSFSTIVKKFFLPPSVVTGAGMKKEQSK